MNNVDFFTSSNPLYTINAGNIALNAANSSLQSPPPYAHPVVYNSDIINSNVNSNVGSPNAEQTLSSRITIINTHSGPSSNHVNIPVSASVGASSPLHTVPLSRSISISREDLQASPQQPVTPVIEVRSKRRLQAQKKHQSRINKIALLIFGCMTSGLMIAGGVMGSKPMILTAIAIGIIAVASWALFKARVSCSG